MNRWLMLLMTVAFSMWGAPASGASPALVYVFNAGSKDITVIDATTNAVIKTIPLGVSVRWLSNEQRPFDGRYLWTYEVRGGRMEHGEPVAGTVNALVISPDGRHVWVQTEHAKTNEVLDAKTLKVVSRLPLGKVPGTNAFSPDGRYSFVTHFNDTFVSVIDTQTFKEIKRIRVGKMQGAVAFRPDGRYAYVAAIGANAVAVIDVSTLSVVNMLPAGKQPWGVLVM